LKTNVTMKKTIIRLVRKSNIILELNNTKYVLKLFFWLFKSENAVHGSGWGIRLWQKNGDGQVLAIELGNWHGLR